MVLDFRFFRPLSLLSKPVCRRCVFARSVEIPEQCGRDRRRAFAGDITVLNGYDGVFHIIAFQIVNDDLAIGTKLGCKAAGQRV